MNDHVEQIINGTKTQTRRASPRYEVGKTYAVQRCRTCKGIPEGRIKIFKRKTECNHFTIGWMDAREEGGYTSEEFERLYNKIHPNWEVRYAYTFRFMTVVNETREVP